MGKWKIEYLPWGQDCLCNIFEWQYFSGTNRGLFADNSFWDGTRFIFLEETYNVVTSSDGITWSSMRISVTDLALTSVMAMGNDYYAGGLTITGGNALYKSTDQGATWTHLTAPPDGVGITPYVYSGINEVVMTTWPTP